MATHFYVATWIRVYELCFNEVQYEEAVACNTEHWGIYVYIKYILFFTSTLSKQQYVFKVHGMNKCCLICISL
jgi:hypothetical protein